MSSMGEPTFRWDFPNTDELLGELILYIAHKCATDRMFGAVKLNKILWWSDFLFYAQEGRPITGAEYQCLRRGPGPRRLLPVRDRLVNEGYAVIQRVPMPGGLVQERVIALRQPRVELFTGPQIALVDGVIGELWGKPAKEVSDLSHGRAWAIAGKGNSIPYEAVFISDDRPDLFDRALTGELAEQQGW